MRHDLSEVRSRILVYPTLLWLAVLLAHTVFDPSTVQEAKEREKACGKSMRGALLLHVHESPYSSLGVRYCRGEWSGVSSIAC